MKILRLAVVFAAVSFGVWSSQFTLSANPSPSENVQATPAPSPTSGARQINIDLFGKTLHFTFDVGTLGVVIILVLLFLSVTAMLLAMFARRKTRQARQANLELQEEIVVRERAEASVHESEARLRAIVDTALDGVISINHEGKIVVFNPAAERIFDFRSSEVIGKDMADLLIPPSLREAHRSGLAHYLTTAEGPILGRRIEITALRADGTKFPIELSVTRIGATDPPTFTGFVRDITERRQVEEVRKRLAAIVESSDDAIISKDLNGIIKTWNLGAEKMFGYSQEEMLEKPILLLIPPDRISEEAEILGQIARGETVDHFETVRIGKDGRSIDVSITISPIKDSDNKITGASKIARNITEFKLATEKINQLNADLEQRVADRTAALEAANKELEAFSYSVSHDLRAPLRHINGFSKALLEDYADKLDEVGRGYLEDVRSASQEMGRLIDDVLQLARVTRSEMSRERVDLSNIATVTLSELRMHDPERKVKLIVGLELVTYGDKRLLGVVLLNLLGNAWKFTGNNPNAEIEFGANSSEGQTNFFVSDNGAGFDMAYADKLYGAFQRLHSVKDFEGTGIGLATVQRIVHRHGGRVWAEGEVNKGATFYFSLPDFIRQEELTK